MGWQEIKAKYEAGMSATEQSVEDMVARKVLRGLGLVEREFPRLEKAVFGEGHYDEPLWSRVERLLKVAFRTKAQVQGFNVETLKVNGKHTDVVDRYVGMMTEDTSAAWRTLFLTRAGKTKHAYAYFIVDPSRKTAGIDIARLSPPFTVVADAACAFLVTQDIEQFIKQFGPYDWTTYVN